MRNSIGYGDLNNSWRYISLEKTLMFFFLGSLVIGYVISYSKLYLFHVFVITIFFMMLFGKIKVWKSTLYSLRYIILFYSYALISLTWTPNKINGLTFIFYLSCALSIVFIIVNYCRNIYNLTFVFKVLSIFFLLNVFIGLLETTGSFRLPASPYAYSDPTMFNPFSTRPSGFNSNINNFGFVLASIFPFIFLYPKKYIKPISLVIICWFIIKIQSKGFFIAMLTFFVFYYITALDMKSTWKKLLIASIISSCFGLVTYLYIGDITIEGRAFTAFEQVDKGLNLILSDQQAEGNSTGVRAAVYSFGIKQLLSTFGLGLGIAGIGSKLAETTNYFGEGQGDIVSFHNFFLEMLVDFGVVPFLVMFSTYCYLILKSINIFKHTQSEQLRYYSQASALALITILPASIAPSSIIYIFSFWTIIAFSISTIRLSYQSDKLLNTLK